MATAAPINNISIIKLIGSFFDFYVRTTKIINLFGAILFAFSFLSCQGNQKLPHHELTFSLNADSTAIRLGRLPNYVISELVSDTSSTFNWNRIFAVYEEGNERHPVSGKYRLASADVLFFPDGGFKKGKTYLAECYVRDQPYNAKEMAAGKSQLFKPEVYKANFEF